MLLFFAFVLGVLLSGCNDENKLIRPKETRVDHPSAQLKQNSTVIVTNPSAQRPSGGLSAPNQPLVSQPLTPSMPSDAISQPVYSPNELPFVRPNAAVPVEWKRPEPVPQSNMKAKSGRSASCMSLCEQSNECMEAKAQTFCKWEKKEPNCYGEYWTSIPLKQGCYFSGNSRSQCREDAPVQCGVLRPIKAGEVVRTVDFLPSGNSCQTLCSQVHGCSKSECTDQLEGAHCQGLYWTESSGASLSSVVHESLYPNLPEHQRVPCGVYGYVS